MAVSEKPFAAEVIDAEEAVYKFDEIGCMLEFLRQDNRKDKAAARFVMDYESQTWIEAERAHYVKSPEIRSPMASGLIALKERAAAERHAAKFKGQLLSWADLEK